ncbi:peroxisomal copper amine oxidase [Rhizina undulata]
MLDRLKQVSSHLGGNTTLPHPFDPLSAAEIEYAIAIVRKEHGQLGYNVVTLSEPKKKEMLAWLADRTAPRPLRAAEVIATYKAGIVYDGIVDLVNAKILKWEKLEGQQPILSIEDLIATEKVVQAHPEVIKQCGILGIPKEDMHKVFCDPWAIGYDERFGNKRRLQQALMYYRPNPDDNQYAFPLDFCPIVCPETQEVIHIDIPPVRRPINTFGSNYNPNDILAEGGYRTDLTPLNITQPQGVSFSMNGRIIDWQNFNFHIGFNYREGIVLNNITYNDKGTVRPLFYRMSLAEMVVPYGNPEHPHQRKHAFDLGEYGAGYMTNSLALGCDCKGTIHYLDAVFPSKTDPAFTIKNSVCIHEEDAGILFKHSDFRNSSVIVTRGRKLVVSQIFTAANYEYCVYWIFHQDATIQLEVKLTGILNTYAMAPGEDTKGWGTEVHPGVNAHNHQHLFCLRLDPQIDGQKNTVFQVDSAQGPGEVGSVENKYGNAFYAKKTKYSTVKEGIADYNGATSRTWDICNTGRLHPYSGKPASYKLVSREVPSLLCKEGGLVWKRAGFARHAVHVTKYDDEQIHPAGRHVPQTSGSPSRGIPEWIEKNPDQNIDNEDLVLWHTFGLTHFPAPEDFPIMPAEPMTVLLRPRHFFKRNPALDVPPSYSVTPTEGRAGKVGVDGTDRESKDAFGKCCGK